MRSLPKVLRLGALLSVGVVAAAGVQACDATSEVPVEVRATPAVAQARRAGNSRGPGAHELTVRGRVTGTGTVIPLSASEPRYRLETVARGPVTHFGRVEIRWVVPEVVVDPASRQVTILSGSWSGSIRTANGDEIVGRYSFRQTVLPIDARGNIALLADLEVTGGTGRFQGATGTGVTMGSANVFTRTVSGELAGTITLAAGR